jgi:hypothetical protein
MKWSPLDALLRALAVIALLCPVGGCVTTDACRTMCFWKDTPPHGDVAQVVVIWADGVVVHPDPTRGGAATPGLAGRVYLFGPNLGEPLAAEGMLTISLFDDQQPQGDQTLPREVWNIDQANLDLILKKDALGWGYNLWLPWSNYRQDIHKVTMTVTYKPAKGREVYSGPMTLTVRDGSSAKLPPRLQQQVMLKKPQG